MNIKIPALLFSAVDGIAPSYLPTAVAVSHIRNYATLPDKKKVSLEQSPSKANNFQLVKKLPALYGNRMFITAFKTAPYHINPAHASPFYTLKIHFNIILPSKPRSSKRSLAFSSPHQNSVCTSSFLHTCHIPPNHILLHSITIIIFGEE